MLPATIYDQHGLTNADRAKIGMPIAEAPGKKMKVTGKAILSLGAVTLAALHQFLPGFQLEPMTLTLLGVAIVIWFVDRLASLDIPGVGKIDFRDAKSATDKINIDASPSPDELGLQGHPPTVAVTHEESSFTSLANSEDYDPNLMLIAFRFEVEQRVRTLVRAHKLLNEKVSLDRMIRALAAKDIIDTKTGVGLIETIALGNQAAHGAKVDRPAAEWVLDVGPSILAQLDQVISAAGSPSIPAVTAEGEATVSPRE